jgi:hypothetical protein
VNIRRCSLAVGLALVAAGTFAGHGTAAATPAKPGRYYGAFIGAATSPFPYFPIDAQLAVSRSGRSLKTDSYVDFDFPCARERSGYHASGRLRLAPRRGRVRIRRDGSFALRKRQRTRGPEVLAASARRRGPVRFRLRGRFQRNGAVRLVYRVRSTPRRPRNRARPGVCVSPPQVARLYLDGKPPFSGCRSQPAWTLVQGKRGRVFTQWRFVRGDGFFPYVFACLFDANLRIPLGWDWDTDTVELPTLSEPFVAYVLGTHCCLRRITVRDLRDGTVVHRTDNASSESGADLEVRSLVLSNLGSVAWIVVRSYPGRRIEVWALDSSGLRMLDSGRQIAPRSLRLNGSTLSWVKRGVVRSATLE